MALDFLAIALTNLATIAERRIDRLVHPDLNQGLPPFLVARRRRELRLHDGAGDGGVARERVQGAVASGERRHDSDRRQQGRRRADGDGRGVEAAPRRRERALRARDRADVRRRRGSTFARRSRRRGVARAHARVRAVVDRSERDRVHERRHRVHRGARSCAGRFDECIEWRCRRRRRRRLR